MRRLLGLVLLVLGTGAILIAASPVGAEDDGCYHDYNTNKHICPEPTTAPPQTAPATSPTTRAATATTRPVARESATTAPKAARTAATVAATTTTVVPTTTTVAPTTTTAAVTLDTEPVAQQGKSSNTGAAVIGAVVAAGLAFGVFQLISRRRSA
jgi:hypothetical protein